MSLKTPSNESASIRDSVKGHDEDGTGNPNAPLPSITRDDGEVPASVANTTTVTVAPAYSGKRSWFRSTFTQATLLGICSFIAPGLWGAMNSLGAGGQASPATVNAANSLTFVLMIITSYLTSSLIKLVGVPQALAIGTAGYSVYAGGLYLCTDTNGAVNWLIVFGAACCGISAGFFWSTEGAIILSYPEKDRVGRYISYWLMFRVFGQLVGGAIDLGLNVNDDEAGSISTQTYIVFIVLQCLGPAVALVISSPQKVQRVDRTPVNLVLTDSIRSECKAVWHLLRRKQVFFLLPMIWQTTFSESLTSTFNVDYFTVRTRALGSFLSAVLAVLGNYALGFLLDWKKPSLNGRAKYAFLTIYTLAGGWWIYAVVVLNELHNNPPTAALDWTDGLAFAKPWTIYLILILNFNVMYELTYWVVSNIHPERSQTSVSHDDTEDNEAAHLTRLASIVRGVESAGQALSYGLNSTGWRLDAVAGLNFAFWGICLIPAWLVISQIGKTVVDVKVVQRQEKTGEEIVVADVKVQK